MRKRGGAGRCRAKQALARAGGRDGARRVMGDRIEEIGEGFWNIRGSFRIAGVVDIGTQCSLVRLASGRFVFLDSYRLEGDVHARVMALTDGGAAVEAILNLHPFHTVHCRWMHAAFPDALLFGSRRHKEKFPDLPWQRARVEGRAVAERYAGEFDFTRPEGVDYISANENVHFSSVLARHVASRTLHVDDTLSALDLPWPLRSFVPPQRLSFHPALALALEKRPGAADDFEDWARWLARSWDVRTVCAAHNAIVPFGEGGFGSAVAAALRRVQPVLHLHRWRYG